MGERKFLTRMERRRKEKESQNEIKTPVKKIAKSAAVLVITASLISYSFNLPHVKAYFTDKISLNNAPLMERRTLSSLGTGAIRLFFNVHRFENLKMQLDLRFEENILVARINLPEGSGFDADDIMAKSIKFTYSEGGNRSITPISVESRGNGLELWFDWDEVESFIDSDDNDPGFDISGKGKGPGESGLGERFTFEGYGEINGLSDYTIVPEPVEEIEDEILDEVSDEGDAVDEGTEADDVVDDEGATDGNGDTGDGDTGSDEGTDEGETGGTNGGDTGGDSGVTNDSDIGGDEGTDDGDTGGTDEGADEGDTGGGADADDTGGDSGDADADTGDNEGDNL